MTTMNHAIIYGYLRAWGEFVRRDRSCPGLTKSQLWDLAGSKPIPLEDPQLERICEAMQYLRQEKQEVYGVLRMLYVQQKSAKEVSKLRHSSTAAVYDHRLDGVIFLSGYLLGAAGLATQRKPGEIYHWGELPVGPIKAPTTMRESRA